MTGMNWEVFDSCYLLRPDSCGETLHYHFTKDSELLGSLETLKSDGGDVELGSLSVHGI